jgi:UDP-hydrolysing UDP-N-acetyl-D-glucosamine 2-epimerase
MKNQKLKICVITSTRAEYGIFFPLLSALEGHPKFDLTVMATGTHLSADHGMTIQEIYLDNYKNIIEVPILTEKKPSESWHIFGMAASKIGDALSALNPDLVILLGDRFEILAAASSAVLNKIPVAHLHGGEVSEGALDEYFRHAITKLSSIHLPATRLSSQRILQLGENPIYIRNVGALGIDNILKTQFLNKLDFVKEFPDLDIDNFCIATVHPETTESSSELYSKLQEFKLALGEKSKIGLIVTGSNIDSGGDLINKEMKEFIAHRSKHSPSYFVNSLGRVKYLSAVKLSGVVLGNSSSGIIEAHSLNAVAVNIGSRQKNREKDLSVIDCAWSAEEISKSLELARSDEYRKSLNSPSVFGDGNATFKIIDFLLALDFNALKSKPFFSLGECHE